ncbi:MAG: hypothetical protein WCY97_00965 [Methanothrix sp.]|nr:hypothetical protein [Methanothrix harundinacea]MDD2638667.1 hypothetical protein [Methanothrix sp.]MDD3709574.1 hypothetical protein [Methanothrix sp.]MDD5768602.1 hypothetical protein [Methanothrix sp.]MDI9398127.1 hypothetical protein [Euryarchaeota archaeon]
MNRRSGAAKLLAIFFCLSFAQAVGSPDEDDYIDESWENYLNYGLGSFYDGSSSSTTYSLKTSSGFSYSQYLQYYFTEGEVPPREEGPVSFTITGNEPSVLSFGWQTVPYSEYTSSKIYAGSNSLWIEGETAWASYAACPAGTWLQLITAIPTGGLASFYEISPSGSTKISTYSLGTYNRMSFYAAEQGRYALFFVSNNQPSNVVIIDVGAEWTPDMIPTPTVPPRKTTPSTPTPAPTPTVTHGDVSVTLESKNMRGYDVYVDDKYVGTEGQGGDALDGIYKLKVVGDQWHTVKVWDGEWFYGKPKYYERRGTYVLKFEPATTLYVYGGMR